MIPTNRTQREQLASLEYSQFPGYNLSDIPANLPPGSLVEGSQDIDLTRKIGALSKRYGIEAQITTPPPGATGVKGIHTYRKNTGDVLLYGHGTDCYKLSGTELTLVKTATADFNAGTLSQVSTMTADCVKLEWDADSSTADYASVAASTDKYTLTPANRIGQAFDTDAGVVNIYKITTATKSDVVWGSGTMTCKVYDNTNRTTLLGTKTISAPSGTVCNFVFDQRIPVAESTQYYVEFTTTVTSMPLRAGAGVSRYGNLWEDGVETADFIHFTTYTCTDYYTSGTWTSPSYDLTTTPIAATIAWTETVPAGTDITLTARASEDNQNWGEYEAVVSGGNIPRGRYVQFVFALTGTTAATPTLSDFTVTYTTSWDTATSILPSGVTVSGERIRFDDYEDECYFADGGRPQRYDGTNTFYLGFITAELPTAPTLTASGDTGNPNGNYYGLVTFVDGHGCESPAGAASAVVSPSSKKIAWTNIPVDATGRVVARNLYRTKAGGTAYFFVAAIADNTTTTYTDDTADAALLTALDTDNAAPPDADIIYEHKGYMVYVSNANPQLLYFSKVGRPDNVPTNSYKSFPGFIKGVKTYQDALIVGGDTFCAAVFGDIWGGTGDNTTVKIISEYEGPVVHESMVQVFGHDLGDVLIFPTRNGLKYLSPGLQDNTLRSTPLSYQVQALFAGAVNRANMAAFYWNNRYIIALNQYGTGTPVQYNNKVLVYDLRTKQWSPPWTIAANGFTIANNKPYLGHSTSAQLYEFEKGTDDAGSNIHAIAVLRDDLCGTPSLKKRFRHIRLVAEANSVTTALNVKPSVDNVEATIAVGTDWLSVLTSPRFPINLGRGYEYSVTLDDDSTNDWIITRIVTAYERGEI